MNRLEIKKQVEQEISERRRGAYSKLIKANETLLDKLQWTREDIEIEINKLKTQNLKIEDVIVDLENILKNNK